MEGLIEQPEAETAEATTAMDDIMQKMAEHKGCGTSGGSGKASCGSGAGETDLPPEIWEKVKNHPCYSEEAHHTTRACMWRSPLPVTFNAITAIANTIVRTSHARAWSANA